MYRLSGSTLLSSGADVAGINLETLWIFHAEEEIPTRVRGSGAQAIIDFYGVGSDSSNSPISAYRLDWGLAKGKQMQPWIAMPGSSAPA